MPIPESQLETWSHQGSVTQSSATYATIKLALEAQGTGYDDKNYEVFLQGSYGNDTNIYKESDVDIVIRLDSTYFRDLTSLPPEQVSAYEAATSPATYSYQDFKSHVEKALQKRFGAAVRTDGKKAIKILGEGNRRSVDVVVGAEFRRYSRFRSIDDQDYVPGILFFTSDNTRIINYPKQHSKNCTLKHQASGQMFKPMVRIVKNMCKKMVEDGVIDGKLAPSYFIEGMLYNVPNNKFSGSYVDAFVNSYNWIDGALSNEPEKLLCANEQYYLLGTSPNTWPKENSLQFMRHLKGFWENWE